MRNLFWLVSWLWLTLGGTWGSVVLAADAKPSTTAAQPAVKKVNPHLQKKPNLEKKPKVNPKNNLTVTVPPPSPPSPPAVTVVKSPQKNHQEDLSSFPTQVPLPVVINVAMFIHEIIDISETQGNFLARVDGRLRWYDPRVKFDVTEVGNYMQVFYKDEAMQKLAKMWHPQVQIYNISGKPLDESKQLIIFAEGWVELIYSVVARFDTELPMTRFPFDQQQLKIAFQSMKYANDEIVFVHSQRDDDLTKVDPNVKLKNWSMNKIQFHISKFQEWDGREFTLAKFQIVIKRNAFSYVPIIFLPLLLFMFGPVVGLWVEDLDLKSRLPLVSPSVLGLVTYNFSLHLKYPTMDVGSIAVQLLWLCFMFSLAVLLFAVTLRNPFVLTKLNSKYFIPALIYHLRWTITALSVLACCYIVI